MQNRSMRVTGMALAFMVMLAGCGEMNVRKYIPFSDDTTPERSRTASNATEYQCAAGKRFSVRILEGGAAVWLILPEREVRLEKLGAGAGMRYSNGIAVLDINGNEATLKDGTTVSLSACKAGGTP